MFSARDDAIAEELRRYGEPETAEWILGCSDDELVRVSSVAGWLIYHGPGTASGASMLFAKACALAAVYVREGAPRELARSRRGRPSGVPAGGGRRPDPQLQRTVPRYYGVGDDARHFWSAVDGR